MLHSYSLSVFLLMMGPFAASSESLDGVWKSEGWASVYEISGRDLRLFEVTSTTCVASGTARRLNGLTLDEAVHFQWRRGGQFSITPGADEKHKRLDRAGSLVAMTLTRSSELPLVCRPVTADTSLGNFDVFTRTFAENYIAFDLRHMDWELAVSANRARITSKTSPGQLFDILKGLIEPLGDIHTGLEARNLKRTFEPHLRLGTDRVVQGSLDEFAKGGRRQLAGITNRRYFGNHLVAYCRGQWHYGLLGNGVGYIRILQFGGYARRSGFKHDLAAMNEALDSILDNVRLRGLVIDVRLSFGGDDRLGLALAARLTAREYVAYRIAARSDPTHSERFTTPEPVFVRPGRQPIFTGPVAELIGPITMSAAETFTQALLERKPHVRRFGENTQGVFCDSLERRLPNGWSFELPNAAYRTEEQTAFDVVGISPDVTVPVFSVEDLRTGQDGALAEALYWLQRGA